MSTSKPTCSICLEDANARGGEPLTAPGCCGKWFHKRCIDAAIAAGNINCPECRAPLPISAPALTRALPTPQRRSIFGGFGFASNSTSTAAPTTFGFVASNSTSTAAPTTFGFGLASNSTSTAAPTTGIASPAFEDDLLPVDATTTSGGEGFGSGSPLAAVTVSLTSKPEKLQTHCKAHPKFYSSLEIKYENPVATAASKTCLDVVCVLDVSGSMQGEKIQNLKRAMDFVIDTMGPSDRLSVVSFNDDARRVHGLARMTEENKETSRQLVSQLHAGGGTSIYDGMRRGWDVLNNREHRNPSSCVFLLTDGQDSSNRERQLSIAREMKAAGTSLFAFGFGADHDSALMSSIAEAAESVFTYVDTPDSVIDAFGGALGSQQGLALRNVVITAEAALPGVTFKSAKSGIYQTVVASGGGQLSARFSNMYPGERRSVLVEMSLQDTSGGQSQVFSFFNGLQEIVGQDLYRVSAVYDVGTEMVGVRTGVALCAIDRLADSKLDPTAVRDRDVDAEVNRAEVSEALKKALRQADNGQIDEARTLVTDTLLQLRASVSYQTKHPAVANLEVDLEDAQRSLSSRAEYMSGGRALMSEGFSDMSRQRSCYTKSSKGAYYQSPSSMNVQSRASASKTKGTKNDIF